MKKKFEAYFRLPFMLDRYSESYVWDDTGSQMVLTFDDDIQNTEFKQAIVNCINTGEKLEILQDKKFELREHIDIYVDDKYLMYVRGWGFLTGSKRLTEDEAVEVQDSLASYVMKQLNKL